jgi:hypothetical protein
MPANQVPKLSEADLADADSHLVAALAILNGRAPSWVHDRLIQLSDYCWQQRRLACEADEMLRGIRELASAGDDPTQSPKGALSFPAPVGWPANTAPTKHRRSAL